MVPDRLRAGRAPKACRVVVMRGLNGWFIDRIGSVLKVLRWGFDESQDCP
jgi:hypothetical protein